MRLLWNYGSKACSSPVPPSTSRLLLFATLLLAAPHAHAQSQEVTFRYVPEPSGQFVRVFLPGSFNNWGPNSNGAIAPNAPSRMTFVDSLDQYLYTVSLQTGQTYEYKVHFHQNESGSNWTWISDPIHPDTRGTFSNSYFTLTDPFLFQLATEKNAAGLVDAVSATLSGTKAFTNITFEVNGIAREGRSFYNPVTRVFRYKLPAPIKSGSQFKITATDAGGRTISKTIGQIQKPVTFITPDFEAFETEVRVYGFITKKDGTVDPDIRQATLLVNGSPRTISVENGLVTTVVQVFQRDNTLQLQATLGGEMLTSDPLKITRRSPRTLPPPAAVSGNAFGVNIALPIPVSGTHSFTWQLDKENSTTGLSAFTPTGSTASGTATGPGELYFDVDYQYDTGEAGTRRIAVIVTPEGQARAMKYEETPVWVNKAVVYEIFPLSFGPTEATGTAARPGSRLKQITAELDYIAQMGFTVLWFMPIMHNQNMSPLGGGYSVIDFYNVDPKLGTNEDFKTLVERAHDLGLKVILDITPSHASPHHPWVESVRTLGDKSPYYEYLQTSPNPHTSGLDGRGPNLPEIWHNEGGKNLYRKYDGFGDLANLNWSDIGLRNHFLDIFAHWITEFDIDGYRIDVYWGPWRRYGPEAFGTPLRQLLKGIKPDIWILGEIEGTGSGTEVYYADDDAGAAYIGGMDAGYDWRFYGNAVRGTYGNVSSYDFWSHNGDFWPGPNARYFRFLENHDEERIAQRYATTPERILPLTGWLLTTTGVPMIYQGQEVNYGNVSGDPRRRPVSWQTTRNGEFARHHQQLAHARTQFPAFWTQELKTISTSNSVYVFARPYLDQNALVAINFGSTPRTVSLNPTSVLKTSTDGPITYHDLFAGTRFTDAELDGFDLTLDPYETTILLTGDAPAFDLPPLPRLPYGASYTAAETGASLSTGVILNPAFPNPFTHNANLRYRLPQSGPVRVEVFDVLGRRVRLLHDGWQATGNHELTFAAADLPAGTYLIRLQAGAEVRTMRVVRVK